jgi:hypothetical protein
MLNRGIPTLIVFTILVAGFVGVAAGQAPGPGPGGQLPLPPPVHPSMPWAGVPGTGGYGVPIRQIWAPPQSVPIEVLVPKSETAPERWDTQSTEIPGYYFTETTLGYIYPERWALYSPEKGRYEWQRVPAAFQPK